MTFAFSPCFTACLAAVLLSIAVADSNALPRSQANAVNNAGTNCTWDCKVVDSTFGLQMKELISEFRLISLQLKYDQQVDEKCVNQTDKQNSSIKLADVWTCLTGDNPSYGSQNMTQHSFNKSNYWFRKLQEGQIKVGVSCSFKPATDSNDTKASLNDVISMVLMKEVAKFAELSHSKTAFCYKFSARNGFYVCGVNITVSSTAHNDPITWQKRVSNILYMVVDYLSLYCFPLVSFEFIPTKIRKNGKVMIVLHETSPESIRSWIANEFFSDDVGDDPTVRQKYKRLSYAFCFFLIALVFSLLKEMVLDFLLAPHNLQDEFDSHIPFLYLMSASLFLLFVRDFVRFLCPRLQPGGPCIICSVFGDKQGIFHDLEHSVSYYGRKEMEMHLLLLPSIVKRCHTQTYLKCTAVLDYCGPSSLVKKLFSFLLFPVWITIYLVYVVAVLLYSSPTTTFYDMRMYKNPTRLNNRILISGFCEATFLLYGSFFLVKIVVYFSLTLFRGCLQGLPNYLSLTFLVVFAGSCLQKAYNPYPAYYIKLAFTLFEHYKKKQGNSKDCTMMIPKDLYDKTCLQMPFRKRRGIVSTYFGGILLLMFVVFAVVTGAPRAADQLPNALGAVLALSAPMIIEMVFGNGFPVVEKAYDEDFDKKIGFIVDDYLSNSANQNASNNNNGSSPEMNSSTDTILPI